MRLYPQVAHGIFIVALIALFGVMAAIAALWLGGCFYCMNVKEIGSVAFGSKVPARTVSSEVGTDAATLVAIKAVCLHMALAAVIDRFVRNQAVISDPIGVMIGGDTFAFMAGVALAYF